MMITIANFGDRSADDARPRLMLNSFIKSARSLSSCASQPDNVPQQEAIFEGRRSEISTTHIEVTSIDTMSPSSQSPSPSSFRSCRRRVSPAMTVAAPTAAAMPITTTAALLLLLLVAVTNHRAIAQTPQLPYILDAQNQHRAIHGVAPLAWDEGAAGAAQQWANTLAGVCAISHSGDPVMGENLYICYSTTPGCASGSNSGQAVDDLAAGWYASETGLDLRAPSHLTQLLWASTTQVGCAVSSCNYQGMVAEIVVCKYYPPGNVAGQFEENVSPLL